MTTQPIASLSLCLAQVLIAAAWADGVLHPQEIECLQDLLHYLPELTANERAHILSHLHTPIDAHTKNQWLKQLQEAIHSQQDRQLVAYTIGRMIHSDGHITPEEKAIFEALQTTLQEPQPDILTRLKQLLHPALSRRKHKTEPILKDKTLDDYIQHKLKHLKVQHLADTLNQKATYTLCLMGIVFAKIAWADGRIDPHENERIIRFLQDAFAMNEPQAKAIATLLTDPEVIQLDTMRVCRVLHAHSSALERLAFIDFLFDLAQSDGCICNEEMDTIIAITKHLKAQQDEHSLFKVL